MSKTIQVRTLDEMERQTLEKLSRSRTAEQRQVERASIVLRRSRGEKSVQIARDLGLETDTITRWVKRFNATGLAGLADRNGRGRKADYDEIQRGQLIATARTLPVKLGCVYGYWTLDRLVEYAHDTLHIPISRAQLARVLEAEGLKWYQEQTYFSERPDPQFAEKRGR
jgi:transposase